MEKHLHIFLWIVPGIMLIAPVTCNKKILILSLETWSHIVKPIHIAEHLDRYGYKMDFVLMSPKYKENVLKYKIKSLRLKIVSDHESELIDKAMEKALSRLCKYESTFGYLGTMYDKKQFFGLIPKMTTEICDALMSNTELINDLQQSLYDAVIIDSMFAAQACHSLLAYKLGVPIISLGTFAAMNDFATPVFPATMPSLLFPQKMSFHERVINFIGIFKSYLFPSNVLPNSFVSKYVPEKPPVSFHTLIQNASLYLIDQDPLMDLPRPAMPNMKFVGGLAVRDGNKLPETFQKWMDDAQEGVIIVSFGSIIRDIKEERIKSLIEAFANIQDYVFVFKLGNTTEVIKGNILKSAWIPQNDLLAHSNTKLFITHCGNNGRMEALFHGVPMLGIPVYGDQQQNCQFMEAKQYGKCLNFCNFSSDNVQQYIRNILDGPYSTNIKKASKIFKSHEKKPSEKAALYIQHFLEYGADHLRNPALDLPQYQLHSIDVIAVLFLVFLLVVFILCQMFKLLKRRVFKYKQKQE